MELELEPEELHVYTQYNDVSILVLMELELERLPKRSIALNMGRFYPCFNGIRVGTDTQSH